MTKMQSSFTVDHHPRWVPERPAWHKLSIDLGMRAAGRLAVGLNGLLGSRNCDRIAILMYHRIAPHVVGLPAPLHNVEPERFAAQLRGLLRRGFQFVSLTQALLSGSMGDALPPRSLLVTFDDGFQTVYTRAWPVLRELEIPATIFVNTAYLDSPNAFPFDAWGTAYQSAAPPETYQPLTVAQCHEMAQSRLVEIGAHTHTHADFRGRPLEFEHDLRVSVDVVRKLFGQDEVAFAFPYGSRHAGFVTDDLVDAARRTGVTCGLTTECATVNLQSDPFTWGRFNSFPWDTAATLAAKCNGWYGWAHRLKQRLGTTLSVRGLSAAYAAVVLEEAVSL